MNWGQMIDVRLGSARNFPSSGDDPYEFIGINWQINRLTVRTGSCGLDNTRLDPNAATGVIHIIVEPMDGNIQAALPVEKKIFCNASCIRLCPGTINADGSLSVGAAQKSWAWDQHNHTMDLQSGLSSNGFNASSEEETRDEEFCVVKEEALDEEPSMPSEGTESEDMDE
jgi:hypothetical protein